MRLLHPTFADVTREVPDEQAAAWLNQGWQSESPEQHPQDDHRHAKPTAPADDAPDQTTPGEKD